MKVCPPCGGRNGQRLARRLWGARRPRARLPFRAIRLLQALQVDRRAVQLTPEEADALLTRLRRGRNERVLRTFPV